MEIREEDFSIGSIVYELSARQTTNGFYGAFFCQTCWQGWVNFESFLPSAGEAILDAKHRAEIHHKVMHSAGLFNRKLIASRRDSHAR